MAEDPREVARRVAARWLAATDVPRLPPFHLPVALVASLGPSQRVLGVDGRVYVVAAAGPGALVLEHDGVALTFTNRGYRAYSWAYFAAPRLHWTLD